MAAFFVLGTRGLVRRIDALEKHSSCSIVKSAGFAARIV
jgi:hypothetical protein